MAEVELVIKIPEEVYKKISNSNPSYADDFPIYYAIKNATPLPKGHGDLVDRSKIDMSTEWRNVSLSDKSLWIANGILNDSKVVIPADKEDTE